MYTNNPLSLLTCLPLIHYFEYPICRFPTLKRQLLLLYRLYCVLLGVSCRLRQYNRSHLIAIVSWGIRLFNCYLLGVYHVVSWSRGFQHWFHSEKGRLLLWRLRLGLVCGLPFRRGLSVRRGFLAIRAGRTTLAEATASGARILASFAVSIRLVEGICTDILATGFIELLGGGKAPSMFAAIHVWQILMYGWVVPTGSRPVKPSTASTIVPTFLVALMVAMVLRCPLSTFKFIFLVAFIELLIRFL